MKTRALREAIERSGMSITDIAAAAGLGTTRLYTLIDSEKPNQNIRFDTLLRLAVVLSRPLETDPHPLFKSFFEDDLRALDEKLKKP